MQAAASHLSLASNNRAFSLLTGSLTPSSEQMPDTEVHSQFPNATSR